ncbi:uncharacterized protein F4807DRAFT_410894 [Annulohypoxylon truncatum]|uniref:uncharacterized protein n=1 Tax=Annulohypoxylon truncatum TaxID=327061 RepID=UPI0020075E97|nr:uncharacterized protein F4807DRAFT_410894 [Annulohypoxylon truncatum]KAI1213379.1 hypothetical protein F4807DRAFT_410894 [Annulohypoxylon truncatum]
MNKTKETIRDFIGKAGHHDTTVHESVDPAVTRETVKPTEHEDINTAVNKEIHQDHFHRTVQPVHDTEVLPEQHKHKIGNVQHREFDHRDHEDVKKTLASEGEKFKDERRVKDTVHTQAHAPAIEGERVHHHIHETIQPVLHKETIQPSVVHTTVPIHETHHNPAQHHQTTSLPPVSMDQYKQSGGTLSGQKERYDAFEGEPQSIRGAVSSMHDKKDFGREDQSTGVIPGKFDPSNDKGRDLTRETEHTRKSHSAQATESGEKEHHSILDKLNPMTSSSGDGKPGFMK